MRMVVDAAHGAASFLAPALFERLGAVVDCIGCAPDGRNINLDCGSTHPEALSDVHTKRVPSGSSMICAAAL